MFTKGLSRQTQDLLVLLSKISFVRSYYLAGGTALSLYFGHRFSNDLDFFSQTGERSLTIVSSLKDKGKLEIFQNDEGSFNGQLDGVKLSFFSYPYKKLFPLNDFQSIKVADVADIACMKLSAISSRGTKRDFIDLYFICRKKLKLTDLLSLFDRKYAGVKYNKLHLLKSLVYFEDADKDMFPKMIENVMWEEVKAYFRKEAIKLSF